MSVKKIIKIAFLSLLSLVFLLSLVLGVHIYQMQNKVANQQPKDVMLLGRIDFKTDIDTAKASEIAGFVKRIPGVQNVHFNIQDGIMVYTFKSMQTSTKKIHQLVNETWSLPSELYLVSEEQMKTGCPADVSKKSFGEHFVSGIAGLFK